MVRRRPVEIAIGELVNSPDRTGDIGPGKEIMVDLAFSLVRRVCAFPLAIVDFMHVSDLIGVFQRELRCFISEYVKRF